MSLLTSPVIATEPHTVKVLYPLHQVAMITATILLLALQPVQPRGAQFLYFALLVGWYVRMAWTLKRGNWRTMRMCSTHTAFALIAAAWHSVLGVYLQVPVASAVAVLILLTLALYGVVCREH